MKRFIALLLCVGLAAPGCAMNQTARVQTAPAPAVSDRAVLADFASQMKVGSHVRATITGNRTIRGTLVKRTDRAIVIQPRARVAEPLLEVPFDELLAWNRRRHHPAAPAARSPSVWASAPGPRSSRSFW